MFLDEVRLRVRSGAGGPGAVTFRREKFVPRGGPDGGDGGKGGSVYFIATRGLSSLSHFKGQRMIAAERGGSGTRNLSHGASADDVKVLVPVGTLVKDAATEELIGEVAKEGAELLVAKGGRGGRGNSRFADSRNQAPKFAELGDPGEERDLILELRLIADVGLVGAPNAGKSTLLAALTAATPRIADYPFTTLEPHLGVLDLDDGRRLVLADVPGLIEGAAEGVGLGTDFLKHLSRTSVLVHLLDCAEGEEAARAAFDAVTAELASYDPDLPGRVSVIALNKVDLPGAGAAAKRLAKSLPAPGLLALPISARDQVGLDALTRAIADAAAGAVEPERPVFTIYRPEPVRSKVKVAREGDAYRVSGRWAESVVARTDMDNAEALARMRRQLDTAGLREKLLKAGAERGDTVIVGDLEFLFEPDL